MNRFLKTVSSMFLSLALCLGTLAVSFTGHTVADAATTDYYAGITATGGTALLGQLHDLIVKTHTKYTSYNDCKTYGPTTDPGLDGRGVVEFYTHETVMSFSGTTGTWNREHVWCQSLSNGLWGTSGGGSDMHHIRPSEARLNGTRGNNKYGKVSNGTPAYSKTTSNANSELGGYVGNNTFEPLDNVKGDVARIVMYVYTHYNNAANVGGTIESAQTHGTLNFTNVMTASNEAAAKKMLLEWNALDPVDEIERYRNEKVYEKQGNRNPFIDNSSYANAIWGDGSVVDPGPGPDPGPSDTLKGISLNASSLTLTTGQTYDLKVTPNPVGASASVNWTSSNPSVASVSGGKVTAKAEGNATITATSTVNPAITATANVTVIKSSSETTGKVTITRDSFTNASGSYGFQSWSEGGISGTAYIYGGEKNAMQFNTSKTSHYLASTTPTGGAIKKVTLSARSNTAWTLLTSSQPYSELSSGEPTDGNSHQFTDGSCTVTGNDTYFALVLGGSGVAYIDSIEVEYGAGGSSEPSGELENIYINPSEINLKEGESSALTVLSVPSSVSANVSWTSSNPSVATVSADGTVKALKAGTATITATSTVNSSIKATATVTVTAGVISDNPKVQAFHEAVAAISSDGTLKEWFTSVNKAVTLYKGLSVAEKAQAESDILALNGAIDSYNAAVNSYNSAAEQAEHKALNGAGGLLN